MLRMRTGDFTRTFPITKMRNLEIRGSVGLVWQNSQWWAHRGQISRMGWVVGTKSDVGGMSSRDWGVGVAVSVA